MKEAHVSPSENTHVWHINNIFLSTPFIRKNCELKMKQNQPGATLHHRSHVFSWTHDTPLPEDLIVDKLMIQCPREQNHIFYSCCCFLLGSQRGYRQCWNDTVPNTQRWCEGLVTILNTQRWCEKLVTVLNTQRWCEGLVTVPNTQRWCEGLVSVLNTQRWCEGWPLYLTLRGGVRDWSLYLTLRGGVRIGHCT